VELGRIKLAFDFDGVLNKLPKPFEIFMRYTGPNDPFSKAGLWSLKIAIVFIIARLPFNLNGKVLDKIPRDSVIISGRTTKSKKAEHLLRKIGFKHICFRETIQTSELEFKIQTAKSLGIDMFVEDRLYVLERLRANGINGVDIREWVKP
jgi:hypothetical protein